MAPRTATDLDALFSPAAPTHYSGESHTPHLPGSGLRDETAVPTGIDALFTDRAPAAYSADTAMPGTPR
jgi:hypothetical protein